MEKFTAAQARELMPNRFNEMIELIHNNIHNTALDGKSVVTITFSNDFNIEGLPFKVKEYLEKEEGYGVILNTDMNSTEFCINWRDDKKF